MRLRDFASDSTAVSEALSTALDVVEHCRAVLFDGGTKDFEYTVVRRLQTAKEHLNNITEAGPQQTLIVGHLRAVLPRCLEIWPGDAAIKEINHIGPAHSRSPRSHKIAVICVKPHRILL